MDEPNARVSPRRLLLALGVTVAVVPVLVFGWFGLGSQRSTDSEEESVTAVADEATSAEEAPPVSAPPPPPPSRKARFEEGQAGWSDLDPGSCHHRTVAFETAIRVTNISTGASATCVVTARGPYVADRIIELDSTVFAELAPGTADDVVTVRIEW